MKLQEQLTRIKEVMGLIVEQSQNKTIDIPETAIKAIAAIEKKYSYMNNGSVVGANYNGDEKVGIMNRYINDTIGYNCWNNMSDKFKAQIYSFCFQSDTNIPYKMKFIAGLANAIDSNISRGSIVNQKIDNPDVMGAIKLIKNNCANINSYYDNYLRIVDAQYKSMDYNDNYKYIWKYRPIAIDRIMNGDNIDEVLKDWEKSFNQNNEKNDDLSKNNIKSTGIKKTITATTLEDFRDKIRSQTLGKKINTKNVTIDMDNFKLTYYEGDSFQPVVRLTIAYSQPGSLNCEACNSVIQNNKVNILSKGTFESEGYQRTYNLFAILPDK